MITKCYDYIYTAHLCHDIWFIHQPNKIWYYMCKCFVQSIPILAKQAVYLDVKCRTYVLSFRWSEHIYANHVITWCSRRMFTCIWGLFVPSRQRLFILSFLIVSNPIYAIFDWDLSWDLVYSKTVRNCIYQMPSVNNHRTVYK